MDLIEVIATFGKAFNDNRIIAIVYIVLPVIGLLERLGLRAGKEKLLEVTKAGIAFATPIEKFGSRSSSAA